MKTLFSVLFNAVICFACSSNYEVEDEDQDLQSIQEPLVIGYGGGGWNWATWEHKACTYQVGESCVFPGLTRPNYEVWYRDKTTGWPNSMQPVYTPYWLWTDATKWNVTPIGDCINECQTIKFVNAENISGTLNPQNNIKISQVAQFACVRGSQLTEDSNLDHMEVFLCDQYLVGVDVGSFSTWVNQWATTDTQRQMARDQLYTHLVGVALGVGATQNTGTAMRDTIVRNGLTLTIQNYQFCVANNIDPYSDPGEAVMSDTFECDE